MTRTFTRTYSDGGRLLTSTSASGVTTYGYDLAGNQTLAQGSVDSQYFAYDAPGRITLAEVPAGVVSFAYNADGQRVGKSSYDGTTHGFVYDHGSLLERTHGDGDTDRSYTASIDEPYGELHAEYDPEGGELDHQYDGHWGTNLLLDPAGDVAGGPYPYEAFGLPAGGLSPSGQSGWVNLSAGDGAGFGGIESRRCRRDRALEPILIS